MDRDVVTAEPPRLLALPAGVSTVAVENTEKSSEQEPKVSQVGLSGKTGAEGVVTEVAVDPENKQAKVATPSPMVATYALEEFGTSRVIETPWKGESYNVNVHPTPIDWSPWKEDPPDFEDTQPITCYRKALAHENCYVYGFHIPQGDRVPATMRDYDYPNGGSSIWTIPALTVLKNNLLGYPLAEKEWPVIASPNPQHAASYLHDVQNRVSKTGVVDMRFVMNAYHKRALTEQYNLGRIWTPLTHIEILWENSPGNYDAAQPTLYPAFCEMDNITLDTRKEITSIIANLRFMDRCFSPDIEQSILSIMQTVSHTKLSLSRLYWRIWVAIAECTFAESQDQFLTVTRIHNTYQPIALNGPNTLREIFSEKELHIQPFFMTHEMIKVMRTAPLRNLLYWLLSEAHESDAIFGLSRCWPDLGDVRLVLPADQDAIQSFPKRMKVESTHLFMLLSYFGQTLGQQHLIDEIGRTVACFLMRPEGDSAWLGHRYIAMQLPPFRSKRSLHFAWAMQPHKPAYDLKRPPFYKMVWVGCVRYMQIALAANTVLNELGVYTALQVEASKVALPSEWYKATAALFEYTNHSCEFNYKLQQVGLRCDWGRLLNRILGSTTIVNVTLRNFMKIPQWSEWLMFQRLVPEGTWMAGQMGHFKCDVALQPHVAYVPTMCGISTGVNDVYYRIATDKSAQLLLTICTSAAGKVGTRPGLALVGPSGLPLDGQFKKLRFGDDLYTSFEFVPRSPQACYHIQHGWMDRTRLHWQLHMPQKYRHTHLGLMGGEPILGGCGNPMPADQLARIQGHGLENYPVWELIDKAAAARGGVTIFGNPLPPRSPSYSPGEFDHHRDSDSDYRIERDDPVDPAAVYTQEFPIHYCRARKQPSVGILMLRYGVRREILRCGITPLDYEMIMHHAIKYEIIAFYSFFEPPEPLGALYPPVAVPVDHRETTTGDFTEMEKRRERQEHMKMREQQEREREEARARKEMMHAQDLDRRMRLPRVTTPPCEVETVSGVDVKYFKDQFRGWAKSMELNTDIVEGTTLWTAMDSMTGLSPTAMGNRMAYMNRYANFLRMLDNLDLIQFLKQVPMLARGEFCRMMCNFMMACSQFLGVGTHDSSVHARCSRFFGIAMDNLATCGALDNDELQSSLQNPHAIITDWSVIGTMDNKDFMELMFSFMVPAEEAADPPLSTSQPPDRDWDRHESDDEEPDTLPPPQEPSAEAIDKAAASAEEAVIRADCRSEGDERDFQPAGMMCSAASPRSSASSPERAGSPPSAPREILTATRWRRKKTLQAEAVLTRCVNPPSEASASMSVDPATGAPIEQTAVGFSRLTKDAEDAPTGAAPPGQ